MAKVKYPFVIYPTGEGGFVAEIPALRGCLAQADTLSETIEELEAVEILWLDTAREAGVKLPTVAAEVDRVKERLAA